MGLKVLTLEVLRIKLGFRWVREEWVRDTVIKGTELKGTEVRVRIALLRHWVIQKSIDVRH